MLPVIELFLSALFGAGGVGVKTGGNDPGFGEVMVEDDETVVKANVAIGKFEVVDGAAGKAWFDEIFEFVTPITEATAEREGEVHFVEQFVAGH